MKGEVEKELRPMPIFLFSSFIQYKHVQFHVGFLKVNDDLDQIKAIISV